MGITIYFCLYLKSYKRKKKSDSSKVLWLEELYLPWIFQNDNKFASFEDIVLFFFGLLNPFLAVFVYYLENESRLNINVKW